MKTFYEKLLYAYKFISQCLPVYAIYTILFIERGMSVNEIALLVALWSVFSIAFEIPSGVLADRWNRRNMLCLSAVLQGLCFVVWFFAHSFALFAAGFILWAISGAFASGTEESLIYDNLKSDGREESFTAVYGKAQFFANAGTLTGIVSAGMMASVICIDAMALLSAAICFVNAAIALLLREKNYYAQGARSRAGGYLQTFWEAGAFLGGSATALANVLFLVLFANLGGYLDEFDALIVNDMELDRIWVSVILAVRFVFVALGNLLAPVVQTKLSSVGGAFLLNGLACGSLAVFSAIWSRYAIAFFGVASMLMTVTEVLLVDIVQNEIKEEGRATVLSFYGAGQNVAMVCFSLLYAFLAGIFALRQAYLILSVYGIAGGSCFYLWYQRRK